MGNATVSVTRSWICGPQLPACADIGLPDADEITSKHMANEMNPRLHRDCRFIAVLVVFILVSPIA
jgi:hypothetical protein